MNAKLFLWKNIVNDEMGGASVSYIQDQIFT